MPHQRPPRDDFPDLHGWRCPLCNWESYEQTIVARADGTGYKTEFFQCSGCSVMFRNPRRFARLGLPIRRWSMDIGPRTLRDVHGFLTTAKPEGER